jgi:hypothetical protein
MIRKAYAGEEWASPWSVEMKTKVQTLCPTAGTLDSRSVNFEVEEREERGETADRSTEVADLWERRTTSLWILFGNRQNDPALFLRRSGAIIGLVFR